jgi:hypothetical protein
MNISNDKVSSIQTYHVLLIGIYTLQIADMLPSKTMPGVNTKKELMCALKQKAVKVGMVPPKKKVRASSVEVEEIEDADSTHCINVRNSSISPASSFQILDTQKVTCILYYTCSPLISISEFKKCQLKLIYLFYEIVTNRPAVRGHWQQCQHK